MHRQGMEADGKFISQEAIDQAMAGEGLESSEVVADGQQPEVRLTIRGGIVLGGFVLARGRGGPGCVGRDSWRFYPRGAGPGR